MEKVILAIDDNAQQLENYEVFLGEEYDFRSTKSASEAMNFLSKSDVDLILLDLEMPNVDGFELLKDIRHYPSKMSVPVIIISGTQTPELVEKAKNSSAADFLAKPIKQDTLILAIKKVLGEKL